MGVIQRADPAICECAVEYDGQRVENSQPCGDGSVNSLRDHRSVVVGAGIPLRPLSR